MLPNSGARANPTTETVFPNRMSPTIFVNSLDRCGLQRALQAADFQVTEEGRPMRVEFFDHLGAASIVFVIDLSSSMQGHKWQSFPFSPERQDAINALTNGTKTRARILLDLIEIQAFKNREHNPAFVLMQYFGYLRRNPDQGGYDFWLNVLNNNVPNNYRSMVSAFLTSPEYQRRTEVTKQSMTVIPDSNGHVTPLGCRQSPEWLLTIDS